MANRFWVGGTDTWNTTAGSKWATTSGGAGGSAVPTAADDVFFDAASGAVTITASGNRVCRSFNWTGFTGTYALGTTTLSVGDASGGAGTWGAGMTFTSSTGVISFISTSNNGGTGWGITTNGKAVGNVTFAGAGGKWVFQDALTGSAMTFTGGTLDTNNQTIAATSLSVSSAATRTLTLGSSAISLSGTTATTFTSTTSTSLTVSANTSVITLTGAAGSVTLGAADYNGLSFTFTGAGVTSFAVGSTAGTKTLGNITKTGTAAETDEIRLIDLTLTGTLTVNGNSTLNRLWVRSTSPGTSATLTVATAVVASYADFMDLTGAGAASWNLSAITGLSGDCGGNSGITFTTPLDRYGVVAGNFSQTTVWSNTSGGAGGTRVPLPQDNVFLDANSAAGTYSINNFRSAGNLDCTGFTRTLDFNNGTTGSHVFGSFILGSGMTMAVGDVVRLSGRGTHNITCNGNTINTAGNRDLNIGIGGTANGTYNLTDDFTFVSGSSATTVNVTSSTTLNTNDNDMTFTLGTDAIGFNFASTSTGNLGTSTLTWLSDQIGFFQAVSGTTLDADQATFVLGGVSAATRTFAGGGKTYGTLRYTVANSTGQLNITGANTFDTLEVADGRSLRFTAATTTTVTNWEVEGLGYGYNYLPGSTGNYISSPDSVPLSITGDIDIRARVAMDDWTPAATSSFVTKASTAAKVSYRFRVDTAGRLALVLSQDGTAAVTATSSVGTGVANGDVKWVRVTWRNSDDRVQFFTSDDGSTWTQLGTDESITLSSIHDNDSPLEIGTTLGGTANIAAGKFYRVQIRNNVLDDGTGIQYDANFETKTFGANSFTESSSNAATVTMNGTSIYGDGRVEVASITAATHTLTKPSGTVATDYLKLTNSIATGGAAWYAGANSVNVSGNSGWLFSAPPSGSTGNMLLMF